MSLSKPSYLMDAVQSMIDRLPQPATVDNLLDTINSPTELLSNAPTVIEYDLTPAQEITCETRLRHAARRLHRETKKDKSSIHPDYN